MKNYVTRIALILLIATSVKSYLFLRGESIHYDTFFSEHPELIQQEPEVEEESSQGILPDVKLIFYVADKIGRLLPAS